MNEIVKELQYPFTKDVVCELKAGQRVCITGRIFTGRDRFHKYLAEGHATPVALADGALYHCGPVITKREDGTWHVGAAGPTTSIREEPYMAKIIAEQGVRIIIGKGGMGPDTCKACQDYGCVYLQTVGGAAALLAQRIQRVEGVYMLEEFGAAEAVWVLDVVKFEAVVGIDAHGNNLFDAVRHTSYEQLQGMLE
ncbi:MAG: FumA C-terminus/TtdB family hydratase beta subunit [bacterium]